MASVGIVLRHSGHAFVGDPAEHLDPAWSARVVAAPGTARVPRDQIAGRLTALETDDLMRLIERHAGDLSGLILVLINWDSRRQDLVRLLLSFQLPVLAFVLHEGAVPENLPPGPLAETPERLIPLPANDVQGALGKVNWTTL